jgi:hypothetical protein
MTLMIGIISGINDEKDISSKVMYDVYIMPNLFQMN